MLLGGNGEGERGPRGRLSVECMEEGRDGRGDSISRNGVVGLGVVAAERKFGVSLDVRDDGRPDRGGSSTRMGE